MLRNDNSQQSESGTHRIVFIRGRSGRQQRQQQSDEDEPSNQSHPDPAPSYTDKPGRLTIFQRKIYSSCVKGIKYFDWHWTKSLFEKSHASYDKVDLQHNGKNFCLRWTILFEGRNNRQYVFLLCYSLWEFFFLHYCLLILVESRLPPDKCSKLRLNQKIFRQLYFFSSNNFRDICSL